MLWFWFALTAALAESVKDAVGKRGAERHNEYTAAWSQRFFALFLLLPAAFILGRSPLPDATFWIVLLIITASDTLTSLFYMRALKTAPLTHVLPMLALSPVFMLFTTPIINHEWPSLLGVGGVLISALGVYFFGLSRNHLGFFTPFRNLWQQEGTRLMLLVAILWGISAPLDKVAVLHSNPYFYAAAFNTTVAFTLLPFMLKRGAPAVGSLKNISILAPIGIFSALAFIFQMRAVGLAFVPHVIAIKRASIFFGALWGFLFFHEQFEKMRVLGTVLLLAGAILIVLS
ncbi:MAG: EamA family transporter [Candidatus Sungiibacteriota bacterium]|uniref:EamA family transporter n=1 Tax=Candidatus Sungiibacteriota bacterium TaxID=2750080 RepID=A0A7T5RJK3_9BACT|nr:MAG: EamA family transporter [Candidatus Sungbacteria bacterium]